SAGGNNPVIFDHSVDDFPCAVEPARVLRSLVGFLQFAAGGPVKVLRRDGFGRKGALFDSAAILPVSTRLHQTLLLALHPAARAKDEIDADRPGDAEGAEIGDGGDAGPARGGGWEPAGACEGDEIPP
ncbi:MAG: type I-E CRISPR-associated protein Cse1/CasA, partial [Blastochloris sp.]|nr:type I-E CRISPR-associated protein Cse1/CasA [Blastochloris sp.]